MTAAALVRARWSAISPPVRGTAMMISRSVTVAGSVNSSMCSS